MAPNDVVEFRVWVPDDQGHLWTTASRFTAGRLLPEFGGSRIYDPFREAPSEIVAAFDTSIALGSARSWLNDDVPVSLRVADDAYTVLLKHVVAVDAEIAYVAGSNDWGSSSLAVRFPRSTFHTREGGLVPALWYGLTPETLWAWNTAGLDMDFAEDEEMDAKWDDAPVPSPLVFERTDQAGEPQPGVAVGRGA